MMHSAVLALAVVMGWLLLARLARTLRPRQRQRALWALIATGVPILGWLTYTCGPLAGIGFLTLGVLVLVRLPLRTRSRAAP
ncbi:hypothetical protein GCM10011402_20530 [Paracoccus acridae]|uniref:DUF2484 family protein n=1 Tax=Paracoccus acridae TaxID=1795310 RepID=A0ABQ1VJK9_9RHOB|nr:MULTISPECIES: DUF2484 family protein [Paracoccus]GGF68009.1 hypothetical protein GCM10011402_20530 [Paracoccus acridae]